MAYDKAVDSAVLDGYFSDIADAIRDKGGSGTYTPAQMPQAIEDLPASDPNLMAVLSGTASGEVTLKGIETLGVGLFFGRNYNPNVTVLNMPDLVSVAGSYTVDADGPGISGGGPNTTPVMKLHTINLPKCTFLRIPNENGLSINPKLQTLTTLNAPLLETLAGNLRGTALTSVNFPELKTLTNTNFANCISLQSVNLPKVTALGGSMFDGCTALKTLVTGKLTGLSGSAFRNCSALEGPFDFTGVTIYAWWTYVCAGCAALKQVEFQNSGSLGNYFFQNADIEALVIRPKNASGSLSLSNINALSGTPIESGTGYIYVPRDQISTYESTTNWSAFAGQFRALEDYTSDGTVDGEFIMPT